MTLLASGLFSGVTFAGGGTPSWQPSVEPINCVNSNSTYFFWSNTDACNEVISKGYAKGVHYSGKFNYDDGSSVDFSGYITPQQPYSPPAHPQGKKLISLTDTNWYWAK